MELFLKCSTMLSVPTNKLPADHDQRQQIPLAKVNFVARDAFFAPSFRLPSAAEMDHEEHPPIHRSLWQPSFGKNASVFKLMIVGQVAAHEADQNVAVVMTNFAQWWLDTFGPGMTQQMIELLQKRATQGAFVSDQVTFYSA